MRLILAALLIPAAGLSARADVSPFPLDDLPPAELIEVQATSPDPLPPAQSANTQPAAETAQTPPAVAAEEPATQTATDAADPVPPPAETATAEAETDPAAAETATEIAENASENTGAASNQPIDAGEAETAVQPELAVTTGAPAAEDDAPADVATPVPATTPSGAPAPTETWQPPVATGIALKGGASS